MSRANPQVNFRIPPELKEQLESAAKENHRSITAELVARLEQSFKNVINPDQPVMIIEKTGSSKKTSIGASYRQLQESALTQHLGPKGIEPPDLIQQQLSELTKEFRELKAKIDNKK